MATDSHPVDMEKVKANAERVFSFLGGALVSGTIYLGNRLGLYRTLQDAGSVTSEELAHKTGLHERWIREWLQGQAVAGLIDYKGDGRFALSPEMAMVLSDENSPMFFAGGFRGLPQQMAVLERLPESFKTGIGLPYDAFGPEGALGIAGFSTPWFHTALVQVALPKLDGVVTKLAAGAKVADIGCGAGIALIEMAKAHPKTAFHGYDISKYALERAEANKTQAGVRNLIFHDANGDALPADESFDFVTTFDCIHDATNPAAIIRAVRQALKPDGTWLIADVHGKPTFEENLADNPMAPLMYGFSVLCCMSSALSEPGGAGLGTLGFHEGVARAMTAEAGFSRFKSHDFDNPINAYYEVRP